MDPRYPVGKFAMPAEVTPAKRAEAIAKLPRPGEDACSRHRLERRATGYAVSRWRMDRAPGGSSPPDSHMNAYMRWSWPSRKPNRRSSPMRKQPGPNWRSAHAPMEVRYRLLDSIHERWDRLWRSLKPEQFARTDAPRAWRTHLDWLLFLYAWHGRHHTAHITELRKQKGW